jgi:hypothetical protein
MIGIGLLKNKVEVLPAVTIKVNTYSWYVSFRWVIFELRIFSV